MIRWLWSKLVVWGWDYSYDAVDPEQSMRGRYGVDVLVDDSASDIDLPDPIRFKVQAVQGGTLIETIWWDYKKDENIKKLHIVTPDEDLADSIGKIVSMELLKK